jgi:DNA repair exonuclease SbcCD ATPase subunit
MILWQSLFLSHLQQHCVDELKDIHDKFRQGEEDLSPEPQDLHDLKRNTDLWQQLIDQKDRLFERLEPLRDKLAELDSHAIQLKEDETKLRLSLMDSWRHYVNMLAEI